MSKFWTFLTAAHSAAGPMVMLVYPLYASVIAMESATKVDDEQWLSYWIIYSFLTLIELILQSLLEWIPIWYSVKLVFVAWLVLPQFQGAAFIYKRVVREQFKKHGVFGSSHHSKSTKPNFLNSVFTHKLVKTLRELCSENAKIKFTTDSKLTEANILVRSVVEKSLEVEAKLCVVDARLAELCRKNSEVERNSKEVEARENSALLEKSLLQI